MFPTDPPHVSKTEHRLAIVLLCLPHFSIPSLGFKSWYQNKLPLRKPSSGSSEAPPCEKMSRFWKGTGPGGVQLSCLPLGGRGKIRDSNLPSATGEFEANLNYKLHETLSPSNKYSKNMCIGMSHTHIHTWENSILHVCVCVCAFAYIYVQEEAWD